MESTDKELFLVDELEIRLVVHGAIYQHKLEEERHTAKFDPNYFSNLISGQLYVEFVQDIYDHIKKLNRHETIRFLTISVAQFISHTPEKRTDSFIHKYWETYWGTKEGMSSSILNIKMEGKIDENEEKYARHILKAYSEHFHLFQKAAENSLTDFKAGLTSSFAIETQKARYESFNIFQIELEYDYPLEVSVYDYKFSLKKCLDNFKKEILDNLLQLSKDERKPYLNLLNNYLENKKENVWANSADLEQWYKKYNTVKEDDSSFFSPPFNPLSEILMRDPEFNRETLNIQDLFYNYYNGLYIDEAVKFILEQSIEIDPNQMSVSVQDTIMKIINPSDNKDALLDTTKDKKITKGAKSIKANEESFVYNSIGDKDVNLSQLHDKLIENEFIKKPKDIRLFKKIFSGKKIVTLIEWASTLYELNFFVQQLIYKKKIAKCNQFSVAVKCFCRAENEKINYTSLRTATKLPSQQSQELLKAMVEAL